MASDTEDEYEDLKQYFTAADWKELSNYEKLRLQNIKRNYQMMVQIGLTVPLPDFMVQKRKKPSTKRRLESSDEDDEEWLPFKKTTSQPGNKSTKLYNTKQKTPKKTSRQPKNSENKENDVTEKKKVQPGRQAKKGKKKAKIPERCYPKRKAALKCYKEEVVPDDDHFIYCEDCQEFYESACLQHPLTIIEDTPVGTRSKNYCRQSLPSGLSIKETTIVGAGHGVFAEKCFSKGVRFGPYKGKIVGEIDAFGSGYAWEICAKGKPSHYVDAKSESTSNWMRFVNCARNENEQNLVAFQYLGQIYYRSFKPIPAGTELLVYYGTDYARDLGIEMVAPSTTGRKVKQSFFKGGKSYCCEECGNRYTIHFFLLKHLKYAHGKPIYIPKKVERSFRTPVMLPKRIKGDLNGQQYQGSSSDSELFSQKRNSFNRNTRTDDLESRSNLAANESPELVMEEKEYSNDEKMQFPILEGRLEVEVKSVDTLSNGEAEVNCNSYSDSLLQNADISEEKSRKRSGPVLGQNKEQPHSLTCVYKAQKTHQCKACCESFNQAMDLEIHNEIHSGEKQYQCKTCGRVIPKT